MKRYINMETFQETLKKFESVHSKAQIIAKAFSRFYLFYLWFFWDKLQVYVWIITVDNW